MKILSNWKLGLLVVACVSLAACGGHKEESKATTETVAKVTTVETTTVAPAKLQIRYFRLRRKSNWFWETLIN